MKMIITMRLNAELYVTDANELSFDDKLLAYNRYNPVLAYDDSLVGSYNNTDHKKLLYLLEYNV